jgi:hypothetical protein
LAFIAVAIVGSIFTVGMFVVEMFTQPDEPLVQAWMLVLAVLALSIMGSLVYSHYTIVGPERIAERARVETTVRASQAKQAQRAAKIVAERAERAAE